MRRRYTLAAPPPDPFGERRRAALRARMQLLGGRFDFETDSVRLLSIVRRAYAGLPSHRLSGVAPRLRIKLVLTSGARAGPALGAGTEPPLARALAAGGILCGAMDGAAFVTITPQQRTALIVVPHELLRSAYHIRYELLEFAVYTLAARVQRLLPLHAACVGFGNEGILLVGATGTGKSTVALHCLLAGLDFVAEDSVLLRPQGLLATGVANFLHLRQNSLRFVRRTVRSAVVRNASVIRRRSGVKKLEIDLRRPAFRLAAAPLRIRAVVFLSRRRAGGRELLAPLGKAAALKRLAANQRYAATQPGWSIFTRQLSALPTYELRRGDHPRASVAALHGLLARAPASSAK